MKLTRRIVLVEPQPTGEKDTFGKAKEGPPKYHPAWAARQDKPSGGVGLIAPDVEGGNWETTYTIRSESIARKPTAKWHILDEDNCKVNIEGVHEKNSGARARWLVLVCERIA